MCHCSCCYQFVIAPKIYYEANLVQCAGTFLITNPGVLIKELHTIAFSFFQVDI